MRAAAVISALVSVVVLSGCGGSEKPPGDPQTQAKLEGQLKELQQSANVQVELFCAAKDIKAGETIAASWVEKKDFDESKAPKDAAGDIDTVAGYKAKRDIPKGTVIENAMLEYQKKAP